MILSHAQKLIDHVYPQPEDAGHEDWTIAAFEFLKKRPYVKPARVLDVGCGQGLAKKHFETFESFESWKGITLGEDDFQAAKKIGDVEKMDFSELWPDVNQHYDFIYSRHALEHSPYPLLTLMEWHRVGSRWLYIVAPAPDFWGIEGQNHYSVLYLNQLMWLIKLAGWQPVAQEIFKTDEELFLRHNPNIIETDRGIDVEYRILSLRIDEDSN